jgi:hypothetical protein
MFVVRGLFDGKGAAGRRCALDGRERENGCPEWTGCAGCQSELVVTGRLERDACRPSCGDIRYGTPWLKDAGLRGAIVCCNIWSASLGTLNGNCGI